MSDEEFELAEPIKQEDENLSRNAKSKIISEHIVRIMVLIAIGIIALIIIITVSVLTYRFMDRGNRARQFPVLSESYETVVPVYNIWTFLTDEGYDLRTQTNDPERYTVSAKIKLGYEAEKYRELQTELTSKNDLLMDAIRFYFSQRSKAELEDEMAVKAELMSKVNSLLSQGEIEQILFLQYQIIGL